ncbi:TrkH family potassium uptake protein [Pilimelia columellifera]|uniref:Potassium transporter TrkG n=1 Tax=Pilimelia columellifera subsp. columellifera TaxID=706583 RepID=A0ABP6AUH7_9ACTN
MLTAQRPAQWQRRADRGWHPTRMVVGGFAGAVVVGTGLLSLPLATESGRQAHLVDALFTATSAVCVTGLVTVDTGSYWSWFGEAVILLLIQAGGLGIMTLATLFTVLLSQRLGVRAKFLAQAETKALDLAGLRRLVRNIVLFSLVSEAVAAAVLTARLALAYDEPFGQALYHGVFHAISAFNNAGFSPYPDNLMRFVTDPLVSVTVCAAIIIGGLGFPVVFELLREWRKPRGWSVLTRITLAVTGALLALGTVVFTLVEWANPRTFGALGPDDRWLAGFFASAQTRTAGFNSVDIGAMRPESLLASDVLMFIGGGSAGTAGGIKVTTFGLLALVIWAEMRGDQHVNVGYRRAPTANHRQALSVALLGVGAVVAATFTMLSVTRFELDVVLFEVVSAFGTVGLSTGITARLPIPADLALVALMFLGRLGPLTFATALALRDRRRRFAYPEERTIVG